jgi:predicted restriction endonuclease
MKTKELVRERFREQVFRRARHRCEGCGFRSSPEKARAELDAHHITDRTQMPAGGYVVENGIALCKPCHERAEQFHATGKAEEGWHPDDLYRKIGSSAGKALLASEKLAAR